ncbi:DUF2442 domain-containing protein [Deinococcus sp. RIT780]|uniref:DUF2442 domain-containing protein n=1 Tax=Deinococcus sp. RIT780 TaxID=2870472 RepID=UPI001C8953CB|nr:DUF2442 domain-containing protein [Deinococcus sp. RIT780]MBX8463673.1 DUF2442 domain-containing protein [Deinococcus sp. RIT780]
MIAEVLPDNHTHLWVTIRDETFYFQIHPLQGPQNMLPLRLPRVFASVRIAPDDLSLSWPGGFTLSCRLLLSRQTPKWLTRLSTVPTVERFRPLLPLLRYCTPGAALQAQPTRLRVMQMFGLREGELDMILRAFPVPETVMLHRLHDVGLFLQHHWYQELPIAFLRRPWAYAVHRHPHEHHLHTMMACLTFGRLDLIEDPIWALARAEVAS